MSEATITAQLIQPQGEILEEGRKKPQQSITGKWHDYHFKKVNMIFKRHTYATFENILYGRENVHVPSNTFFLYF